jgi:protein disulfide-isomerase
MLIRTLLVVGLYAAATARLAAVAVGDSYEKVVQEKGTPTGVMKAGEMQILRYADQTIKLKGGAVVSIAAAGPSVATSTPSVRSAEPAKRPVAKPPAPQSGEAGPWITDYAAALEEAKTSDRHTFLFFTGSDWCGWCKRLVREILATPEFTRYARENLVLVELDFPRGKSQSDALKAQNAQLARRYKIEGYPTVVVLNSEGKVVGELGYQPDGPGPFIEKLRGM